MKQICLYIIFLIIAACACKKQETLSKQEIAVDASIEEGGLPIVFLTRSTNYESVIDKSSYFDIVLTKAKVTVSTDDDSEVLILFRDNVYFPDRFYRGNSMRGKAGKTYYLEIVLDGDTITSKTTIPPHVDLQNIKFERDIKDSTKGLIWVGIDDPKDQTNYYRAFTKSITKQNKFVATHLSIIDDESFNGKYVEFPLYKGFVSNTNKRFDYRFPIGDTVDIKFCTIDKESYSFWSGYEREIVNGNNPFGAEGQNLKSNIKGGIGVWTGYGVTKYRVITK